MSNGVNQCAACGGLWDDDEPHAVCPSDHTPDPTDEAVALLKSIGLDITYTDEGLRVVAEQIGRLYVTAPRTLTVDDPEPAVGSIVMDRIGDPWRAFIGYGGVQVWASAGDIRSASWANLHRIVGPVRLLHDGEA